jgi:2-polyprenyl-6-methoxyphenol hydroxylase-like FAD-dependent oxidoreductase
LPSKPELSADIIVTGAGAGGATIAAVLGQQGWRVLLLDERPVCPPVFKAEKVLHDEMSLLRDVGLLEPLLPHSGRISKLVHAYNGRIIAHIRVEQIGLAYSDLVNTLRANLPASVKARLGRVERISSDGDTKTVHLADGEKFTARLVVLACGAREPLLASLGLRRRVIQKEQCVILGFNLEPADSSAFSFDAITYFPTDPASRIDYLTLFKFRDGIRANLFTFLPGNGPWIREFVQQPGLTLERAFPKLPRVTGKYCVTGKVEVGRADLYRMEGAMPDGVVLIGDAGQSACPSTGLGLRKAFTDVAVLARCVPEWFSTPGMSAEKIRSFYDHPRKRRMDNYALQSTSDHRRLVCDLSLPWRLRRLLLRLKWNLPIPQSLFEALRRLSNWRRPAPRGGFGAV